MVLEADRNSNPFFHAESGITPQAELRQPEVSRSGSPANRLDPFLAGARFSRYDFLAARREPIQPRVGLQATSIRATEVNNGLITEKVVEMGGEGRYVKAAEFPGQAVSTNWQPDLYFTMTTITPDGRKVTLVDRQIIPTASGANPEQVARNLCFDPGLNVLSFRHSYFAENLKTVPLEVNQGYQRSRYGHPLLDSMEHRVDWFLYEMPVSGSSPLEPELRPAYLSALRNATRLIETEGFMRVACSLLEIQNQIEERLAEFLAEEVLQTALSERKQELTQGWRQALQKQGADGKLHGQDVEMIIGMIENRAIDRNEEISRNAVRLTQRLFRDLVEGLAPYSKNADELVEFSIAAVDFLFNTADFSLDYHNHAQVDIRSVGSVFLNEIVMQTHPVLSSEKHYSKILPEIESLEPRVGRTLMIGLSQLSRLVEFYGSRPVMNAIQGLIEKETERLDQQGLGNRFSPDPVTLAAERIIRCAAKIRCLSDLSSLIDSLGRAA